MFSDRRPPSIALLACEPSGDALGQQILQALREGDPALPPPVFQGTGGALMAEEGFQSLFPMEDLSVMGLVEVVPRLPLLIRRHRQIRKLWQSCPPDLLITIDAPGFTLPLARYARTLNIPVIHAVAPSVWAWKPGRAAKLAATVQHLWALLPFEPPLFEKEGLPCTFVGNPLVMATVAQVDQMPPEPCPPLVSLWPGSRAQEVRRMLPLFIEAFRLFSARNPDLAGVVVTLESTRALAASLVPSGMPLSLVPHGERASVMRRSRIALATSGTVTLELACAGVPLVAGYTMNPLTWQIIRRLVRTPWITLPNIVLHDHVVPEMIQEACTPEALAEEMRALADPSGQAVRKQKTAFAAVRQKITCPAWPHLIRETVQSLLPR